MNTQWIDSIFQAFDTQRACRNLLNGLDKSQFAPPYVETTLQEGMNNMLAVEKYLSGRVAYTYEEDVELDQMLKDL